MKNKDVALQLLDQIIEKETSEDELHKKKCLIAHKGSKAMGESWTLFHLKVLKGLLKDV